MSTVRKKIRQIEKGSVEFLTATVKCGVAKGVTPIVLNNQVVELSLDHKKTWVTAGWVGTLQEPVEQRIDGQLYMVSTRKCQALVDAGLYDPSTVNVYARIVEMPETPVVRIGEVTINA